VTANSGMNDKENADNDAALVRRLLAEADRATLATCLAGQEGWPYASLVLLAVDDERQPLLLLSNLAEHAKNIAADNRVSLLIDGTQGFADPLAGPRATLIGYATATDDPAARQRFLARHPGAAAYAGFTDFRFYRVAIERAHLVAGFGRIRWIGAAALAAE